MRLRNKTDAEYELDSFGRDIKAAAYTIGQCQGFEAAARKLGNGGMLPEKLAQSIIDEAVSVKWDAVIRLRQTLVQYKAEGRPMDLDIVARRNG